MTTSVFLSVGRTTPEQEAQVQRIIQALQTHDLAPRALGRTTFASQGPLRTIREEMARCSGVVVVAFERTFIEAGIEKRGGVDSRPISSERIPTVWNQIEAAMGYMQDKPLLVLVEKGLRLEGLLEMNHDWYVHQLGLDASELASQEFQGLLMDWKGRVEARAAAAVASMPAKLDPEKITVPQILNSFTVKQLWGAGAAVLAASVTIFGVGATLGKYFTS